MIDNLSLIVAVGKNNEIGKDNKLLWHLPNELQFFKKTTMNKTIIMGRKTFESLPGKLPNRKHVIITNNKNYVCDEEICYSINDVLDYIKDSGEECFIIGGASIYEEFINYARSLYITKIASTKEADAYFPIIDEGEYDILYLGEGIDNNIKYEHYKYIRKE